MIKTLFVFGTRPEAIKLCPVLLHLRSRPQDFQVRVCVTGQHRSMLDQVLGVFGVTPEIDLRVMEPGQTLSRLTARVVSALEPVLQEERPDMVLVQGDTTTTFAAALASFYHRIPVGHVEAGLRTGDLMHPFPEEMNRLLVARIATIHFAATEGAARNLLAEGLRAESIHVTGNSGVDAVLHVRDCLASGALRGSCLPATGGGKKLVLVTAHRRESFGTAFESICSALQVLARREDVHIVYPVHRNPSVREPVQRLLGSVPNISLIEPLEYVPFVDLMQRAYILLTDSGGIQEEGPSLGKPVLVMREKTERPEAVEQGTVRLVGTDQNRIIDGVTELLDNQGSYMAMSRVHNPYGDGRASERIGAAIYSFFSKKDKLILPNSGN